MRHIASEELELLFPPLIRSWGSMLPQVPPPSSTDVPRELDRSESAEPSSLDLTAIANLTRLLSG